MAFLLFLIIVVSSSRQCNGPPAPSSYNKPAAVPVRNPIGDVLRPDPAAEYREGIAAANNNPEVKELKLGVFQV